MASLRQSLGMLSRRMQAVEPSFTIRKEVKPRYMRQELYKQGYRRSKDAFRYMENPDNVIFAEFRRQRKEDREELLTMGQKNSHDCESEQGVKGMMDKEIQTLRSDVDRLYEHEQEPVEPSRRATSLVV